MEGRRGGGRWDGGLRAAIFRVDQPGCGLPGQQDGNFQGPLVLTKEQEGRLVVREVSLPEALAEAKQ